MTTNETQPFKTPISGQTEKPSERFNHRILETEIDPNRFIPAKPGTKRPDGRWKGDDRGNHPEDVGRDSLIETGNGLLVIDIDDEGETPQWVWDLIESNPTLTVQSPHAEERGGHYYYLIDEAPFDGNEHGFNWGEVKHGALTVTPGSEVHGIRGTKDCKYGCCTPDDPGRYTVKRDLPLAPIEADDLPDFRDEITGEKSTVGNFDSDLEQRIEHGRECNEKFNDLCRWASKGGDGGERSSRECELACHLAFWLEQDKGAVREAMNYFNPPKWSEEGPGYRESVLKAVDVQQDSYEQGGGESGPSSELTAEVYHNLVVEGSMKTSEMAEVVNRGETQTRKALEFLAEKRMMEYRREGRSGAWHLIEEDWDILETIAEDLNSLMTMVEYRSRMKNHGG